MQNAYQNAMENRFQNTVSFNISEIDKTIGTYLMNIFQRTIVVGTSTQIKYLLQEDYSDRLEQQEKDVSAVAIQFYNDYSYDDIYSCKIYTDDPGYSCNVGSFEIGDRVVAEPHSKACGVCENCRQGNVQIYSSKRSPGWGIDGAFTDYLVMPYHLLHKIPDNVTDEVAALAEPFAIAVHEVLERGKIEFQDFVVVSGSGPIGIISAFMARAAGAGTIVMTGLDAGEYCRFDVAKQLGVDRIINVQKEKLQDVVMDMTNGRGADIVIETSAVLARRSQEASICCASAAASVRSVFRGRIPLRFRGRRRYTSASTSCST